MKLASVPDALQAIDRLRSAEAPRLDGLWTVHQMLVHCAQSVEYSIDGYPRARSWLFRTTVGPLAKRSFLRRGEMSHDVGAPIPGAPQPTDGTVAEGCARLRAALEAFDAHSGELAPHFAYGKVTKSEYERLHAMHLGNHLAALHL